MWRRGVTIDALYWSACLCFRSVRRRQCDRAIDVAMPRVVFIVFCAGFGQKSAKVLFLGLDNAGKTTLMQLLAHGKVGQFQPTHHPGAYAGGAPWQLCVACCAAVCCRSVVFHIPLADSYYDTANNPSVARFEARIDCVFKPYSHFLARARPCLVCRPGGAGHWRRDIQGTRLGRPRRRAQGVGHLLPSGRRHCVLGGCSRQGTLPRGQEGAGRE